MYIYIYWRYRKKQLVYVFPLLLKIPKELSIVRDKFFFYKKNICLQICVTIHKK